MEGDYFFYWKSSHLFVLKLIGSEVDILYIQTMHNQLLRPNRLRIRNHG